MANISELYNGELKTCPRCKGHKYIRGQKVSYKEGHHLPNYKKIEAGVCFLCDGKGKAFYTTDNRVLKAVHRYGVDYIVEYSPVNGKKIGMVSSLNHTSKSDLAKELTHEVNEEEFFPTMYEMVWNDWSKVADVIFEEYPNAKPVSVDKFYSHYHEEDIPGDCINFLLYYDECGSLIKPFYINPPCDTGVDNNSYKGIVMLNKDYIFGVSGTYVESKKMLYLGIKTSREFKYYEVSDIKYSEGLIKEVSSSDIRMTMLSSFLDKDIKKISKLILKDLYEILG